MALGEKTLGRAWSTENSCAKIYKTFHKINGLTLLREKGTGVPVCHTAALALRSKREESGAILG